MNNQPTPSQPKATRSSSPAVTLSLLCILTCFLPFGKASIFGYTATFSYMDACENGTLVLIISIIALVLLFFDLQTIGYIASFFPAILIWVDILDIGFKRLVYGGYIFIIGVVIIAFWDISKNGIKRK